MAKHQTIGVRAFGNDSCPATRSTEGYTMDRNHTFCYGPYATGELGANITSRMGLCCNGTTNASYAAPVEVVVDPLGIGTLPKTGNCYFSCNATFLQTPRAAGGELAAFSDLEHCLHEQLDYGKDELNGSEPYNPYHIWCVARTSYGSSHTSGALVRQQGYFQVGFGLLAAMVFAAVLI